MIDMPALSAIAGLPGTAAPQGEPGEEAPVSAQFAQLLTLQLDAAAGEPAPPPAFASPAKPSLPPATGKQDGKTLPDFAATIAATASLDASPADPVADAEVADSAAAALPASQPEVSTAPGANFAALALPVPPTWANPAGTDGLPASQAARALPAMPPILRLPLQVADATAPRARATQGRISATADPATAHAVPPVAAVPVELASAPRQGAPLHVSAVTSAPGTTVPMATVRLQPAPRKAEAVEVQSIELPIGESHGAEPIAEQAPASAAVPPATLSRLSAVLRQIVEQPASAFTDSARPPAQAATAQTGLAAIPEASAAVSPSAPIAPAAPEPVGPQAAIAAPQAAAQPAFAPASTPAAPHDFVQLIDRLVEAREAVRLTMAPQPVEAAIAHAEFGQVSLRFEPQDSGALSVSLASPDPDFARAVQAAAPAAQSNLNQDSGAAPQRGDASGQQSQGAAPGQSQSQHRGQPATQHEPDPRPRTSAQAQSNAEARPERRNGIFA